MANKQWIDWNDECPNCGDGVKVHTDADQEYPYPIAYDGDTAKCVSCKWEGSIDVYGEDEEGHGRARLSDGNLEELEKEGES